MSDIKLFNLNNGVASEIQGTASHLEKPLQNLIEKNLEAFLGIRFLASEYSTGKTHAGRIDTLGLDENNCPVIIEYKRSTGENIINQGLFYLDWLMDHQAEFTLLAMRQLKGVNEDVIDWSAPRLICIAGDFTKYDSHAVQQINRNIELIRYRQFGTGLLLFELVNAVEGDKQTSVKIKAPKSNSGTDKSAAEWLAEYNPTMKALYESLEDFILSLGDDVQRKELKLYVAFKKIRNFATVVPKNTLALYLNLNPGHVALEEGFSRDMRGKGHWGTGDLEVVVKNLADLDKAKPFIEQAYEGGTHAA